MSSRFRMLVLTSTIVMGTVTAQPAGLAAAPGGPNTPEPLVVGTLFPETGDLASLGPPLVAGARLAVGDINASGGVFGAPVQLVEGDSGTDPTVASQSVDGLLASGSDVIVGAAASSISLSVIDQIVGAGVIQFSPSNTSPALTNYPDMGLYFRTAPSDTLQAAVLAELIVEQSSTAAVVYRYDNYGQTLAGLFAANFAALGGQPPTLIPYPPTDDDFADEVAQIAAVDPEAVLVISFQEAGALITTMDDQGVGPAQGKNVWGVDGFIAGVGSLVSDPAILTGLRGTLSGVDFASIPMFIDRLDAAIGGSAAPYPYAAETYDAIVITALAALTAGSDDPERIASEIVGVTRNGTVCTTFVQCRELLAEGVNIDYDGLGGPFEFNNCGEPTTASFAVLAYDGDPDPIDAAFVFPTTENLTTGPLACQQTETLADVLDSIIPQGGPGSNGLYATLQNGNYAAFIHQVEALCCLPSNGKLFTRSEADLLIGLASELL
ncbi:MAG: ABC transporter substrate-binding protein [Acidimicrobiia bacterium]|nr:ABC transporter substrate-binding protein [Acidimicrobiia bacterium]